MKNTLKNLFLLVVSCTLLSFTVHAQNSRSPLEDMANAIKNDRIMDMEKYFDNFVPITLNGNQAIYSRNQAEVVLRDFFDKNTPRDFNAMENGAPDNNSKFMIGTFDSQNAKFNVYILMKLKDGNYIIQDLRLNKE